MPVDPTNTNRELAREWKRLIHLAKGMGHGTVTIKLKDGKPYMAERAVQQIKLDDEGLDEKKLETTFL